MYELFANYYDYHRQNEVYTSAKVTDLQTAVEVAKEVLSANDHYKSITVVLNDSDVKTVTRN